MLTLHQLPVYNSTMPCSITAILEFVLIIANKLPVFSQSAILLSRNSVLKCDVYYILLFNIAMIKYIDIECLWCALSLIQFQRISLFHKYVCYYWHTCGTRWNDDFVQSSACGTHKGYHNA